MKIKKEDLLKEENKGVLIIDGQEAIIYGPRLTSMDLNKIKSSGVTKIIIAVTIQGVPILTRGDLDNNKIIQKIMNNSNEKFAFFFIGDIYKKILYLDENSPQDWQYSIPKSKIRTLKLEISRLLLNWKLPF